MLRFIFNNPSEVVAMILTGIGLSALLLHRNLIRKVMGLHVAVSALCLFMTAHCRSTGLVLPEGLLMTALASSCALTAIALALTLRLYRHYGVLDVDKLQSVIKGHEPEYELEQNQDHALKHEDEMAELWTEILQLRNERELEAERERALELQLMQEREHEHELELELDALRLVQDPEHEHDKYDGEIFDSNYREGNLTPDERDGFALTFDERDARENNGEDSDKEVRP